ncbi:MAG: hypothetical protein ACT4O9_12990 [Blastocatellia bacterium]
MTAALRKNKKLKANGEFSKADRIAIKLGGRRFKADDAVVDPDFELEEFLEWRNERRKAELEVQKDCQL